MAPLFVPSFAPKPPGGRGTDSGQEGGSAELLLVFGAVVMVVLYFTGTFARCCGGRAKVKLVDPSTTGLN